MAEPLQRFAAPEDVMFVGRAHVLLMALDNLGVNVTALIAGLGIGGIAVALATQNILGDIFAIAVDRARQAVRDR